MTQDPTPSLPPAVRTAPRPGLRLSLVAALFVLCLGSMAVVSTLALTLARERAVGAARRRVDTGMAIVQRIIEERQRRLGDEAELLAGRPNLVKAFTARDQAALDAELMLARNQFGITTAAAIVDEKGMEVAEQPPRQLTDLGKASSTVRSALAANQTSPYVQRRGVDARVTQTNAINELGLTAVYPIAVDGKVVGAVALFRVFNDGFAQELAAVTGLEVAVLTSDSLVAGSREIRDIFQPPNVRPPDQRLAPVNQIHQLGDRTYVATGQPLRAWVPVPPLPSRPGAPAPSLPGAERAAPTPAGGGIQGAPIVATLFVGENQETALAGLDTLRRSLLTCLAAGVLVSLALALLVARWVERPISRLLAAMGALTQGTNPPALPAGSLKEGALLAASFNAMGASLTARIQTLRDELRKLEAVIDSVAEGIVVLDDQSHLVTANETAQRLLGLPGGLPAGVDLQRVLTASQWDALRPAILRQDRLNAEISLQEPRQAIVRVAAVPVHDDFARPLGRAIVLQDVTEERLLDNVKADFFTAMSHELRTPLSAIKGAAELLLDDNLPTTQEHFVQTIHRNADRLGRLVTDLLDLGKLESGRVELRLARVDLNEIVNDVVAALSPVAERDGQHLVVHTADETLTLVADHGRLEQIVTNLVSNSCQYTPESGEIEVATWREEGLACLSVHDNGIGISTVDQQHLFDKFYQGVNTLTHKRGGSGLGLTIVKHLTELHGGTIEVQSKLGSGSSFTARFPLSQPAVLPLVSVAGGDTEEREVKAETR